MMQPGGKRLVVIGAAIGWLAGMAAYADSPAAPPSACPRGPVSIYFPAGEATVSPQTQAVLGKVRETAGECAADRFDIVAHVDAAEGQHALGLALDRLKLVAERLVALGLPVGQIRLATDTPDADRRADVGRRQLDIQFWKREETRAPENAEASRPRVIILSHPNEI
jgi:hypothetical protein